MSEGINFIVRYETPSAIEEIDTARYVNMKETETVICWYPDTDVDQHTPTHDLVNREEKKTIVPTSRIIDIEEINY